MNTEHFMLAQSSSIDGENNSLSVFHLIEDLTIQSTGQKVTVPCQAIIVIKRGEEKGAVETQFEIRVADPENQTLITQKLPLKMGADHRRTRVRVNFHILIEKSGDYKVDIVCKDHPGLERQVCFHINLIRQIPMQNSPKQ